MRKCISNAVVCILSLIFCAKLYAAEKILLTTQIWPPYQVYHDNILDGPAVTVVKNILEKMEVPYEINVYPWERAQFMVKVGAAQGFFLASKNNKRDAYATFSEVIFPQKWNWYLLRGNPLNPTDESFKDKSCILVRFGSNMQYWLQANHYKAVGSFKNTDALVKALLAKRCDAILANELAINNYLEEHGLSSDIFEIYPNMDKPLGVYWSNQYLTENPDFLDKFNYFVRKYRPTDEY
ncbi:transporter substrate-binding domain-containing protein [Vibrio rhizosphaerae]|uniref:Transporter substrate-binding domain-containing protein n=1 Tax=Vibrio rhizosphaerae TaxID=398736 RepID=A0ABU4IZQ8_9VIBR|nr:transporter substrate-binding domain-containing protein [Vibrio rhizosphaerae]MDW6094840.1 transporter substrate-binding domain-containing protein [Vibrio rhizosphaerae]